jgi:hypothetical protein
MQRRDHVVLLLVLHSALPPLFDFAAPIPYVGLQKLLDEANAWGSYCYEKGAYIEDPSEDAITRRLPGKNSPHSLAMPYRLDGSYSEVGDDDTAFGGQRSPRFAVLIVGVCASGELPPQDGPGCETSGTTCSPMRPGPAATSTP